VIPINRKSKIRNPHGVHPPRREIASSQLMIHSPRIRAQYSGPAAARQCVFPETHRKRNDRLGQFWTQKSSSRACSQFPARCGATTYAPSPRNTQSQKSKTRERQPFMEHRARIRIPKSTLTPYT
jgi:hypothetical protein